MADQEFIGRMFDSILDESVLHRAPGGRGILKEQLHHLVKLAAYPHIDIRVLPYTAHAYASPEGPFQIFEMPDPFPEIGFADTPVGGIYVEAEGVEQLILRFDRIRRDSLDSDESVDLIRAIADEL